MPAMLAADKVGLHREGQILMYSGIFPKNPFGIGISAFERLDAVHVTHHPFAIAHTLEIDKCGRPTFASLFFGQAPSAQVVRTSNDARLDSLRHPDFIDEVADLGMDFEQIASPDFEVLGVDRIDP